MLVVKTRPSFLQQEVKFFYSIQAGPGDHGNRVNRRLPDGTLDLVFTLAGSSQLSLDAKNFATRPVIALTGLHTGRTFLSSTGLLHEVGAVLQPGFATRFFPFATQEPGTTTIDATLLLGNAAHRLQEQLQEAREEQARHKMLERFLLDRLRPDPDPHTTARIAGALQQIHAQQGCITLQVLYRSQYMSERNFRRQFTAQVSISPKRYSTIVRVKSFCQQYQQARVSFIDILRSLDYSDPAHFHKDFQKIVGTSPGAYFADINPLGKCYIGLI